MSRPDPYISPAGGPFMLCHSAAKITSGRNMIVANIFFILSSYAAYAKH